MLAASGVERRWLILLAGVCPRAGVMTVEKEQHLND
jgi:hypothetical protein